MNLTLLILMYITLAGFFTLWGREMVDPETGVVTTPYPWVTAIVFGLLFPLFLVVGFIKVVRCLLFKKEY